MKYDRNHFSQESEAHCEKTWFDNFVWYEFKN